MLREDDQNNFVLYDIWRSTEELETDKQEFIPIVDERGSNLTISIVGGTTPVPSSLVVLKAP